MSTLTGRPSASDSACWSSVGARPCLVGRLARGEHGGHAQRPRVEVEAQVDRAERRRVVDERERVVIGALAGGPVAGVPLGHLHGSSARGAARRPAAAGGGALLVREAEHDLLRADVANGQPQLLAGLDARGQLGVDQHAGDAERPPAGGVEADHARHQRAPRGDPQLRAQHGADQTNVQAIGSTPQG